MPRSYLTTSQIAQEVGVHPNTVRQYEAWGLLPTASRTPKGYRRFTPFHLDQMRLARMAFSNQYPGKKLRQSARDMVHVSAQGDLGGALEMAYQHLALVQAEKAQADAAVQLLERWAQGASADATSEYLSIGETAELLNVSKDMLRNWERNGLIRVPRNRKNGYRIYTHAEISRLRVIRMLSRAGYSLNAVLRMLTQLEQGYQGDLRTVLDTPRPDEDVYTAADRWLTTLSEQEQTAQKMIALLEAMIALYGPERRG